MWVLEGFPKTGDDYLAWQTVIRNFDSAAMARFLGEDERYVREDADTFPVTPDQVQVLKPYLLDQDVDPTQFDFFVTEYAED